MLDDKRGKITVTAWKEQLEEAAKKMAGKTGFLLLRGQLPELHRGENYDESLLTDTLIDLFKRSTRKLDDRWTAEGAGEHEGCLELTNVGYANYKMQRGTHNGTTRWHDWQPCVLSTGTQAHIA